MKTPYFRSGIGAFLILCLISCEALKNANKTQKGAAIGAATGGVLGGILGKNSAVGAILGTVVGGAAGAYIGNRMDRQAEEIKTAVPGAKVERVGEGISVSLDQESGITFGFDSDELNPNSQRVLHELARVFDTYPDTKLLIAGHTDNTGNADYNMQLSKRRAMAVANYLKGASIASSRITVKWYGESQPQYSNDTPAERAKNRRVEIAITADEKMQQEARAHLKR